MHDRYRRVLIIGKQSERLVLIRALNQTRIYERSVEIGINDCIKQLKIALCDTPRFIMSILI
jgi:hypothetical protein